MAKWALQSCLALTVLSMVLQALATFMPGYYVAKKYDGVRDLQSGVWYTCLDWSICTNYFSSFALDPSLGAGTEFLHVVNTFILVYNQHKVPWLE